MTVAAENVEPAAARPTLSKAGAERLSRRVDELIIEREQVLATVVDATGDAGDVAQLAARDMELERIDADLARYSQLLGTAQIVDTAATGAAATVTPGVVVRLAFAGDDTEERYVVGTVYDADEDVTIVTPSSPLGQALLGAKPGDEVTYLAPRGRVQVTVAGIG